MDEFVLKLSKLVDDKLGKCSGAIGWSSDIIEAFDLDNSI